MKVLISNYVSEYSTEATYFNVVLNTIDCKSTIWPQGVSTFDIFDITKPDLHITHHQKLTMDLMFYLRENPSTDIAVNITGIEQEQLSRLEDIFSEYNVKPALFFVNQYDHNLQSRKNNITTILPGADIFLSTEPKQYDIEYGIFIDKEDDTKAVGETYHFITSNPKLEKSADIFLPIDRLGHMYHNYQNLVLNYFYNGLSQLFFDAAFRCSTFFNIDDRSILDIQLNKLLGEGTYCNLENKESGNLRDKILRKHTCLQRTKSLLSQLPCKQYTDRLQELIERSIK